jgi:hypothetical protein
VCTACGDRAGLVEHDGVDAVGGFEHFRALDQDAELGAAAGADQQRGRRGQAQSAGAGDDQDGDRRGERRCRAVPGGQPRDQRADRERDDDGHEDPRDLVGQALRGGLAALRLLDQLRDLCQLRVGADAGGAHHQAAARVDGRADHGISGAHFHGH